MPTFSSDARFLGVDLHSVWRDARKALQGLHQSPLLAWLTPAVPVRLLQVDGAQSLWLDGREMVGVKLKADRVRCVAMELPDSLVLRRGLTLPSMSPQDIASAVALEVQGVSPFGVGNAIWGYSVQPTSEGSIALEVALASRKQVAQYVEAHSTRLEGGAEPEVWVRGSPGREPIVFIGYGETQRNRQATRWRRIAYGFLVTIALLCAALALTPTAQLRLRALEAANAYGRLAARVAPVVREREELLQSAEKLSALAEVLNGRIEPLALMDRLTQVLSDDTALQSVKLQGAKVTIMGLTGNSSVLMQVLGEQPGLKDVRAPSAAIRTPGSQKESFVIEFVLDPQQFGVQGATVSSMPLPPAVQAAYGSVSPGASAEPLKAAPAPPPQGAATFGGGAAFGGTRPAAPKPPVSSPVVNPVKP